MTSILGIVIALAGLIVFAYRGASVLLLAPAMAMVAVLLVSLARGFGPAHAARSASGLTEARD